MEPVTGLAAVLASITEVVTAVITWIGSYMGAIMDPANSLLTIFFAIPLVGLGIGAIRRLVG